MKIIYSELFKTEIGIFTDRIDAENHLTLDWGDKATSNAIAGMDDNSPPMAFLLIECVAPYDTLEGLLVHEIVHLCDFLFDYKGVETRCVNSEVKALFCEWAFNKIRPMLRKKGSLIYLKEE